MEPQSKKQQIIDLYENEIISYDLIAHKCNCEISYVKKVINDYELSINNTTLHA